MQNHLTKKAEKGKPQTAAHASMSLIGSQRSLKEDRQHAAKVTACRISRSGLAGDSEVPAFHPNIEANNNVAQYFIPFEYL
jgi:hypothetical protein